MSSGLRSLIRDGAAPAPLTRNLDLFEPRANLPAMALPTHVAEDYRTAGLSLKAHPCAFFRTSLGKKGVIAAEALKRTPNGRRVKVAGLVLNRQRPQTSKGVVFMGLLLRKVDDLGM